MRITTVKMNRLMIIGWLVLNSLSPIFAHAQIRTRVILVSGGDQISRANLAKALTAVIQEANRLHEGRGNLENVRPYCTENGFRAFKELVEKTGMFSTFREYRVQLLETGAGQYEIRGLQVRVNLGETAGDPIQELVFLVDFRLYIDNIHFALETHHYQRLIEEGKKLNDMSFRQKLLGFVEAFRTAHNRKDIDFLERAYSDDALIIVGHVLQRKEDRSDLLASSTLGDSLVQFIKLSKREYLNRLRRVFQNNSFVRVIFEEIEIVRHPKYPEVYGIHVKQRWNSSAYSDAGYLFVMIDFENPQQPLIHVRAWQPQKFADGSVIGLGDFDVIPGAKQ